MHNQRTYLPDVWAGGFVAAIPVSQANILVSELKASSDIRRIFVEEELFGDQDWVELVIQAIGDKFFDDPYVYSCVESLAAQNNTSISAFGHRRWALKNLLHYLSKDKKVLIYITFPLRNLQDRKFMHLVHLTDNKIGMYCHVLNERDVPIMESEKDIIRKDAIWFTEKDKQGITSLYSLSDFNIRKELSYYNAYKQGKFGAIPNLNE